MKNSLLLTALLGAALAYGTGCGDGGTTGTAGTAGTGGTGGSTAGSAGTAGSSTGGTGGSTGGSAGTAGSSTGGTGGTTGGAGGMTGSGGSGGTMMMSGSSGSGSMNNLINGCDPMAAEDHTADATTTIAQMGLNYTPKCIKIKAGSSVKFTANFMFHPLVGGEVQGVTKMPDPNSPIKSTSSGMEATFAFPAAGTYGFYCDVHALTGMTGAIFVE